MKKLIIFTIILFSISLNAVVTDEEVEYMEEYWHTENPKEQIKPLNFKTKNFDITTEIIKYNYVPLWQDENEEILPHRIPENNQLKGYLHFNEIKKHFFNDDYSYAEYQAFEQIVCDKTDYINLIFVQIELDSEIRFKEIVFTPYIFKIITKLNDGYNLIDVSENYKEILNYSNNSISLNLSYSSKERYPYYNKEKIINRLVETGFCKKDEIIEGKIVNLESVKVLSLEELMNKIKDNDIKIDTYYIVNSFVKYPLTNKTVQKYNDIAYYLQQANANDEAIFILEKIIEKYPNRTVAYLNLADAYLGINDKEKAKENYKKYIELMKQDNKEEKIPKRVLEFK
ncbi:tetratricopeptide repeat protein [Arcobacter vandammei]|uniref:tetratricopeptide repeat protein n=1 Tax=Arcobacter vandammei TaxID=2782243 RepID=UPI0018E01754|nr:tetratricopeptide repeat protein [Arcobacter vandammei]